MAGCTGITLYPWIHIHWFGNYYSAFLSYGNEFDPGRTNPIKTRVHICLTLQTTCRLYNELVTLLYSARLSKGAELGWMCSAHMPARRADKFHEIPIFV